MPVQLKGYQVKGATFLRAKNHAVLGDEPGLGKTFAAWDAALTTAASYAEARGKGETVGYTLIVCPPHLMEQWQREIERYSPGMWTRLVYRGDADTPNDGVYIVSYNSIQNAGRTKLTWLWKTHWDCIIFDEAHRMRNKKAQQFKNGRLLRSHHKYMLTGTPMENNPADIWALLHICDRKKFSSYWRFVEEWIECEETPWAKKPERLWAHKEKQFHIMLSGYMLRRYKKDELEIPPVIWDVREIKADPKVKAAYAVAKDEYQMTYPGDTQPTYFTSGGAMVAKLRQFVSMPPPPFKNTKLEYLKELVSDLPQQQLIVFTWFKNSAEGIISSGALGSRKTYLITGDTPKNKRTEIEYAWKADPTGVFIGTLATISEGMNLQNASTVIFYETNYLPGTMAQAVSRVERMGQVAEKILAYVLLVPGTVDKTVYRVSQKRHTNIMAALLSAMEDE